MATPSSPRSHLSPIGRALRLQRIFARMQDGASYAEIAAEEGLSRERVRQIVRAAAASRDELGWPNRTPNHVQMQITRLTPALRLAAAGIAQGDAKSIPLLLQIVDRLDRYSDPDQPFRSPVRDAFVPDTCVRRVRVRKGPGTSRRFSGAPRPVAAPPPVRGGFGEEAAASSDGNAGVNSRQASQSASTDIAARASP